jgi:hypothetical protein
MSDLQFQLRSLRTQHEKALRRYEFDQANLIYQQIRQLQQTSDPHTQTPDFSALDLDHQRSMLTALSANNAQLLTRKKTEIATKYLQRRQAIEERFVDAHNKLCLKHTINLEKEATKPTLEVQGLLQQSTMLGRIHDYSQARKLHEQAMKIQAAVTKRRRAELDVAFVQSETRLNERKARDLALLEENEKAAILLLENEFNVARKVISNCRNVKDCKEGRLQRMNQSMNRSAPPSPRRAKSVSRSSKYSE